MRIDAYNKINQVYQTSATTKVVKKERISGKDTFEVSTIGKDLQIAKQAVNNAPDIREDKVEAIKKAMASGTYSVDADKIADKIISKMFDTLI